MRISIIAYNDNLIDEIQHSVEKNNHNIQRINLSIDQNELSNKSNISDLIILKFTNFHDLTVEIMDFEPQAVLYFPINLDRSLENQLESFEIIQVELVEHIIEILQVVNARLYFIDNFTKTSHRASYDDEYTEHLDYERITVRRNKLVKTNSKSQLIFLNSGVKPHEKIVELLLDTLK